MLTGLIRLYEDIPTFVRGFFLFFGCLSEEQYFSVPRVFLLNIALILLAFPSFFSSEEKLSRFCSFARHIIVRHGRISYEEIGRALSNLLPHMC